MKITEIPAKGKEQKQLRVAAYARVSADKDAAFHSLEAQTEYYEQYVSTHPDWTLVAIYSDNAISGTTINRPEFQRMLEDCRAGKIDLVITKSVTRFARNTVILLETIRELKKLGVDTYFEKEDMHGISPDGELLITLLAMYAEEEARSASENQKWRIQKRFENGEPWVGNMLGYRLVDRQMVIVPEEAEIVRQIYSDYLSGMGKAAIARKLIQQGVSTPSIQQWNDGTIAKILRNEKYAGDMLLQKTYRTDFRSKKYMLNRGERRQYFVENNHTPIIDRTMFAAVQEEIHRREKLYASSSAPSEAKNTSPFRGYIVCGICGGSFTRKHQKCGKYRTTLWGCIRYLKQGKLVCPAQKIPESILLEKTKEVLGTTEITQELLADSLERIEVAERNHLKYILKDGTVKDVFWEHPSRSLSWTSEMRQKAREKALKQHGKEPK